MIESRFIEHIAQEVQCRPEQVSAAIGLLDKGASVPFVVRYRKDVTDGLDEARLERIEERNAEFIALTNRRDAILENIAKQDKLTDALRERIEHCLDHLELEDLYLPFKKQRRSKATMACEQGLEPFADFLWNQMPGIPSLAEYAESFVDSSKAVSSPEEALEGALNILSERVAMDADARGHIRSYMFEHAELKATGTKVGQGKKTRYEAFYDKQQPLREIPAAQLLTMLRGARAGVLRLDLVIDDDALIEELVGARLKETGSVYEPVMRGVISDAYKRLLRPDIENEVISSARKGADDEMIQACRNHLRDALLTPGCGATPVIGIVIEPPAPSAEGEAAAGRAHAAVVDNTGACVETAELAVDDAEQSEASAQALLELMRRHAARALAVGKNNATPQLTKLVAQAAKNHDNANAFWMFLTGATAAIHAGSKNAREELPEACESVRIAVSLARSLQDPLAELVKVEPRNIVAGQHQSDVNQRRLREMLNRTVVSCVSLVGVDANTAPAELLRYVNGIQMGTAQNIIEFRTQSGGFTSRAQLNDVAGIGEKTFEQCAGFLRVKAEGAPLDATSIHPEACGVVERMATELGVTVSDLVGNASLVKQIDFTQFVEAPIGERTLDDIRYALLHPDRDPRPPFRPPQYIDGVCELKDLEEGMEAEGLVTNVTDFGAFVDIGVLQDGLIHRSELANRFVRNPHEFIKVGQVVRVKVTKVDKQGGRISLSRKAASPPPRRRPAAESPRRDQRRPAEGDAERPRRERRERTAGDKERREGRPDARSDRPPRQRGDKRGKPRRSPAQGGRVTATRHGEGQMGDNMNTQLADQLADLREKLD
mgnify:CR=1 FL=1